MVWTGGGWVTAGESVPAALEKEAILCKIEPTVSLASPGPSSKGRALLGVEGLDGRLEAIWTVWGPDRISIWGLWAGERGTGEQLISGTGMDPCEGVGECAEKGKKGWCREKGGVSEELSRLLREADGLAEVEGGLLRCWRPTVLLGGGFGGLGLMDPLFAVVGDAAEVLVTKLSRSKGNLLRRGISLALGWGDLRTWGLRCWQWFLYPLWPSSPKAVVL